jgi:ubiquinone biosynthesis protein
VVRAVERARQQREQRERASNQAPTEGVGTRRSKGEKKRKRSAAKFDSDLDVEALLAEVGLAPSDGYLPTNSSAATDVLQPLHRRRAPISAASDAAGPSLMRKVKFSAGRAHVMQRLVAWLFAMSRLMFEDLFDILLRRGSPERRAVRLRRMFERMGGTAIKIGQQIAMRIDLIPYTYSLELSKLLDKVAPFPVEDAIKIIERSTGRPLADSFVSLDPKPIGSGSVACVFQGILHTGERVAVKVRRPGIGKIFAADCRAIGWAMTLLESLTVLRVGFTANLVTEFRDMLLEELDFVKEARSTELFSRGLRKAKIDEVRAPRLYFHLSSVDVLVMEFVTGIFMSEIIAAIEQKNTHVLALIERLGIEPKKLATRLLRTNHFCMFENLIFHADPHPANIIVRPGGEIVLIDFGSCGSYTWKERHIWRQLVSAHRQKDAAQMAQAALALIEPLPPIDLDTFTKQVEQVFWQDLYAFNSKHSEWWERTSAKIWISFLELARTYQIPMNLNILRMIRSTLLYETVAARLWPKVSSYHEHHIYARSAGKRARDRIYRETWRTIIRGPDPRVWLRVEQLRDMGSRTIDLAQRLLDASPVRFLMLAGKAVYAVSQTMITLAWLAFPAGAAAAGLELYHWFVLHDDGYRFIPALKEVLDSRVWEVYAGFTLLLTARRVLMRLGDPEVGRTTSTGR